MIWIQRLVQKLFDKKKKTRVVIREQENADYLYDVMMGRILTHIRRRRGLSGKTLRVVLVDDHYEGTELVLEKIYPNLNYLTIVTTEAERFENLAEDICYDSGLMIGFSEKIPHEADVILEPIRHRIQINQTTMKVQQTKEIVDFSSLRFTLNGTLYDAVALQNKLWGERTLDLRLFGNGEIPEEYMGCIDISGSKRV